MARPFHVVIWGASGFTGRLVCEHVARDYKGQIKWAMAGRSKERLEQLRLQLSETYGEDLKDVPILLGDMADQSSIDAIARDTHVIITTAGPFVRLGTPIADAAVRMGAHYCDITGESSYVMHLIKTYDEQAREKKVRIVPCCGYDSIPSDLGSLLVVDYIKKQLGKATAKVVSVIVGSRGGFSGGTVASGMEMNAESAKRGMPQDTGVYSHVPPGAPKGDDKEFWGVEYEPTLHKWLGPFVMQVINSRVVHRSAALLHYGSNFHYQEAIAVPNWFAAQAVAWGTAATWVAFGQKWLHPLLKKMLPAPGEGPSRDAMLNGFYKHKVVGYTQEEGGAKPTAVVAEVADPKRDPGYWGTSRMLLEAGLCLALQQAELDRSGLPHGGVLTPATAMGPFLIDRLRTAGLTYEIKEVVRPE